MDRTSPTEERIARLLSRDYLYEDPASYRAGVMEAAEALLDEARRLALTGSRSA
ncbi:MAG: hypothetical protein ACRDJM_10000 [Actinomycetota bacterium]